MVSDQAGSVIQNAKVFVYQPGTTTDFTGSAFAAKTGGSPVTNGFLSNNQGEVEAWFDTPQTVDVRVTDNTGAAFYPTAPSTPISFSFLTEANWDLEPAREDHPTEKGVTGSVTTITAALQAADIGSGTKYAPDTHVHAHSAFSANPHGDADHSDVTRTIWLPVNDGVVLDGGILASLGAAPDVIRTISLADAATNGMAWAFVPTDWASGAISFQIYMVGATTTAGSVRWSVDCKSVGNGASVAAAGTTVAYTSTALATANLLVKDTLTSSTVTPGAASDIFMIDIRRLGADGADTYAAVLHVTGILISYTAVN